MSDQTTPVEYTEDTASEPAPVQSEAEVTNDPSLTPRNTQYPVTHSDPIPDPGAPPKVDPGDSGAEVGTGDAEGVKAAVAEKFEGELEKGYRGHNPDPVSNDSYTVAGVTGGNA
jgi:hypothetical protein